MVVYKRFFLILITVYMPISSYATENYNFSDISIMGQGHLESEWIIQYILEKNPSLENSYLQTIVNAYMEASEREGVNHDVAIAQMVYHTNFLLFSHGYPKQYNNFASIGGADISIWFLHRFSTIEAGVYAHVQHLKSYASEYPVSSPHVDPRFEILKKKKLIGSATQVSELSNKWSDSPYYGKYILDVLRNMYFYNSADAALTTVSDNGH